MLILVLFLYNEVQMQSLKIVLIFVFALFISVNAQEMFYTKAELSTNTIFQISDDLLPLDNSVKIGKLENGLTYYIRKNNWPEKRAELRLVLNAGSILEDENQRGLAHFVEHMCFNGTKNFEKQELVNYLESIGMRFGPDLNAYTSFDETVYMLSLPTDSASIVETALQILEDWAHNVSFDEEEIDKERGVVIEEWRSRRGAQARMFDQHYPVLLHGSQYAVRLPIGLMSVIENADYETVKRYYSEWYRPDLMAVIAVGDFDVEWIESLIIKQFSRIPSVEDPKERTVFRLPDHKETLISLAKDPEASQSTVSIYYKHPPVPNQTEEDYRERIVSNLYNLLFNTRLGELNQQADPPFISANSSLGGFVREKTFYTLNAMVKEDGIEKGFTTLLKETERVNQHGFTATEFERAKARLMRIIQSRYEEREKYESRNLASEFVRHFLRNEPVPGIEFEYELYIKYLDDISIDEVNKLADELIIDENRVVLVSAVDKEGLIIPTENDLLNIFDSIKKQEITPYEDALSDLPLLESLPSAGKVVEENYFENIKVTEWKLSNGATVVLKNTDFKADEIRLAAFSPGGNSLAEDDNYIPALTSSIITSLSGIGNFSNIDLQKILAGKRVNVNPTIAEITEGLRGVASPKDVETFFQLIYLTFTSPRIDSTAFQSYIARIRAMLQNKDVDPGNAFQDTIQVTLSQYHPRRLPWSEDKLDLLDMNKSFEFYKERFADASNFTFFFVGNFSNDELKPYVEKYLASLPAMHRKDGWRNLGIEYPKGIIKKEVRKGVEPVSQVRISITGDFDWNAENNYNLQSLSAVARIKLRELIREDLGGTYGVRVSASGQKHPAERFMFTIQFGCNPDRVDELVESVFSVIDTLKAGQVDDTYIVKVKETQRRERETNLKDNEYWLNSLYNIYFTGRDLNDFYKYEERIENLTADDVYRAALKYLDTSNYIQVVLLPEE